MYDGVQLPVVGPDPKILTQVAEVLIEANARRQP